MLKASELPKLLNKSSLKGPKESLRVFSCEIGHYSKSPVSIFQEFFASLEF